VAVTVTEEGGSLGHIRNRALELASAPVIAFVDSDCEPQPGWLAAGLAVLSAQPRVGVVQGRTSPDPALPRGWWDATQDLQEFTDRYEACNVFYRVDALRAAGGFDASIGQFGEDTAAGWAVRAAGWDAAFAPAAHVFHTVTHPGLRWHLRRALGYGAWNALVRRFPEMRRLLWGRYFLRSSDAAYAAALAGCAVGARDRRGLVLLVPYLWMRKPGGLSRRAVTDAASVVAFDAAIFAGLVRGSVRARRLIL